ncbi:MAG: 2-amino-4-hydroxy-6-hydroxymethyldihydropteridine diphosphokinase [Bacteroidales bacterium]|nr:2-amino-4-hydroxy-6-hydroxymethyldihydropteridine diphosphokinase [Bacteroidales bacterium]
MNRVYLLLGSNMGDREATLNEANLELIDSLLPDYLEVASLDEAVNTSEMMETEPWGFSTPVDPFLNQSFCCLTELDPQEVLQVCQRIETELGRERKEPQFDADGKRIYESRPIDIDILAFERQEGEEWKEVTVNTPELVIPHPQLQSRDFAAKLYKEIKEKKIEKTRNKKK